jgi:hypothetical protein
MKMNAVERGLRYDGYIIRAVRPEQHTFPGLDPLPVAAVLKLSLPLDHIK